MKKQFYLILFILFMIIIIQCSKNTTETINLYTVSGTVYYQGHAIENASVSIDNKINFSTQADNNGYFVMNNVEEGDHVLIIQKTFDNGSFVEQSSNLIVNEDIILNSLILPKAVILQ